MSDEEEQPGVPPRMEAPEQRFREWRVRITGSPADVLNQAGVKWADGLTFARNAPTDDGDDGWTPIGPRNVGGSVRALAQDPDPAHHSTFFAGTSGGGLWRTTDDGNTWEPLANDQIGAVPVCAVAVAPSDRQVVYVGTGEAWNQSIPGVGLFRSLDGGGTFARMASAGTASNGDADHYTRICVHPLNPRLAWVASSTGLWRFNDTTPTQELSAADYVTDLALAVDPDDAEKVILLAGVYRAGVRHGSYDRRTGVTTWSPLNPMLTSAGAAAANIGRIKVAIAPSNRRVAYALVHDLESNWTPTAPIATGTGRPQPLYASANKGLNFRQPSPAAAFPPDTPSPQAWYSMALEVHPANHLTVVAGHVNLYVSSNGGVSWNIPVPPDQGFMTWVNNLTFGTVAEHGDIHAIVFDLRDGTANTPRIWVGNDGGLSFTDQWVVPGFSLAPGVAPPPGALPGTVNFNWRKRSYGILGAQAVDISTHPQFPSIVGIGMQDNATFVSYGGPTWYQVGMADGGALAFHPTNPRRAHMSWQQAVAQLTVGSAATFTLRQPLPDVDTSGGLSNRLVSGMTPLQVTGAGAAGQNTGVFRQLVVGDPATANRVLVAATGMARLTTNGTTFNGVATGGLTGAGNPQGGFTATPGGATETSAMAFVPASGSNRDIYIGTSRGDIFTPPTAPAPAPWGHVMPFTLEPGAPAGAAPWVACIAVHPTKPQVVAACAYQARPALMLSHNGGTSWFGAAGSTFPLPDVAVTSLAWHPTDERVLYVGTLVGVFVARDLPVFNPGSLATSANPAWRTFNRGMGPLQVNDLEVVPETLTLRAVTFSRGAFEASLRGTGGTYATLDQYKVPAVKLSIRDHVFDDARPYPPARRVPGDPRLPVAASYPHLNGDQSIDIKVNAPEQRDRTAYLQSERFGHSPDGAELDEQFFNESPISGDTNIAYIQVHNRGWRKAENVQVFLYAADASAGTAPPLTGLNFPSDPPEGFAWRLLATQTAPVLPGQPRVFRFAWICPVEIQTRVALLAICRSPDDEVTPAPSGVALTYVQGERRAALRLMPVVPDRLFIRDGLDDRGQRGAVVWGGRSPDVIVMTKADADAITPANADNPTTGPFADLNNARRGDRVRQGDNTVFIRVHNRGAVAINAQVQLYRVPLNNLTSGGAWTQIGAIATVNAIPPRGWKMARIQLLAVPADPVPTLPAPWGKAFVLAAVARAINPANGAILESFPDVTTVTGVDEFWTLFTRGALGNNTAFRALRFQPAGGP